MYIRLEMYVQNIDSQGMFAPFAEDVKTAFEDNSPRAVIIDARQNSGGDNAYLAELFEFLALNTDYGMLFHFIDEGCASASMMGAAHLKSLGAILLGQPIGQNTDFYAFSISYVRVRGSDNMDIHAIVLPEDADLDGYMTFGIATDEYPYFEIVTMTVREFMEMTEHEEAYADESDSAFRLNCSDIFVAIPNMPMSARVFGLDLEFYTLRPHILIDYTIQDWINNHDPLLVYVIDLLR